MRGPKDTEFVTLTTSQAGPLPWSTFTVHKNSPPQPHYKEVWERGSDVLRRTTNAPAWALTLDSHRVTICETCWPPPAPGMTHTDRELDLALKLVELIHDEEDYQTAIASVRAAQFIRSRDSTPTPDPRPATPCACFKFDGFDHDTEFVSYENVNGVAEKHHHTRKECIARDARLGSLKGVHRTQAYP